jgi:polyisoprenyl-phosphate glycosyltransferase
MQVNNKKKISVVIPVYNEEDNIVNAYKAVSQLMGEYAQRYDYEIIFTDNHSEDNTFPLLQGISRDDKRVKVVRFSRNFGFQKSIYTGYLLTSGDAAIQLDCDLQDPPQLIHQFIKKWEEGYSVVYGVRKKRQESWFMNTTRKVFYRLISFLSTDKLPPDAGDFRLVDKKVIDELRKLYDYYPYIRGLIASFGFEQIGIPYDRLERKRGKSKFSLTDNIDLAIDGIVNHSIMPLRLATYSGFFVFVGACFMSLYFAVSKLFFGQDWPKGFATIILLLSFSLGLTTLLLGTIGEYVGRIYQQVKRRPIVIVDKIINLESKNFTVD